MTDATRLDEIRKSLNGNGTSDPSTWKRLYQTNVMYLLSLLDPQEKVRAALQEWVDYFDRLDTFADPNDLQVKARRICHGKRIEKSRAALG